MSYYLGIDGGGTKTAYQLIDEDGRSIFRHEAEGISYHQYGIETIVSRVSRTVESLCAENHIDNNEVKYTVIGLPCYGEDKQGDQLVRERFSAETILKNIILVNDVEVAARGALGDRPGIHLVCGTGSIAMSQDEKGQTMRAGGWSESFSDEGAGTWLGRKAIELFTKQADGRIPEGQLYAIFHEAFDSEDDFQIMTEIDSEYRDRRKLASLQMLLSKAALANDEAAIRAYDEAAYELSLLIRALIEKSGLSEPVTVTCTGGIFANGELIQKPLKKYTADYPISWQRPLTTPVMGAALMALRADDEARYHQLINNLK